MIADYGKLSVEWDPIAGEDTFVVYKSAGRSSDAEVVSELTGNRFDDADVEPGVDYFYRIRPSLAGSLLSAANCPGSAAAVAINGMYAYMADGSGGLQIVGISDPRNPQALGAVDTSGNALGVDLRGAFAYGVHVSGASAYVTNSSCGLCVASLSNLANPTYAGSYNTPGSCLDVALAGDFALVGSAETYLHIVDVSQPAVPSLACTYEGVVGYPEEVTVSGGYAFIAQEGGLVMISISNPTAPTVVTSALAENRPHGLALRGRYVYLAERNSAFRVVDLLP